jgi:peptide/nickel transport system permease protein
MLHTVLRRLALSVPVVFLVSILTFLLTALTPGDPGKTLLGTQATPAAVAAIDKSLGLDRPIYLQYWSWVQQLVAHGSLGHSVFSGLSVISILNSGLPITLTLIIGAVVITVIVGIPLGVVSARLKGNRGRFVDALAILGFAIPSFWLGLLLVILFTQKLHLLPPSGWESFSATPLGWLKSSTLPILTLAVSGIGVVAKQTRDGMLQTLNQNYIRSLRMRGVSERSVLYKHALRNALPNTVNLIGLYVVSLLLGTTLVESVFALQGLGTIAVQSTSQHDLPVLQGVGVYFTVIVVVVFCFVDLIRAWLNPRIRVR